MSTAVENTRLNLILTIGLLLFGFAFVSTLVVPNLPYKAAHSDIPLGKTGRVCGQCERLIEQDVPKCPHCGH